MRIFFRKIADRYEKLALALLCISKRFAMMSKALIPSEMKNPGLDWLGSDPLLLDNRNCEFSEQFEIGYDHNHRCEENANPSLTT